MKAVGGAFEGAAEAVAGLVKPESDNPVTALVNCAAIAASEALNAVGVAITAGAAAIQNAAADAAMGITSDENNQTTAAAVVQTLNNNLEDNKIDEITKKLENGEEVKLTVPGKNENGEPTQYDITIKNGMSNKVTKDLYKYWRLGETGAEAPISNGQSKEETPVNTSSDSGIEMESRQYKELVVYNEEDEAVTISVGKISERLYRLYNNVKVYCSGNTITGLLFFIVFVIAIRNRKEDGIAINKKNIEDRTNLC